jgi:hypothetical protein
VKPKKGRAVLWPSVLDSDLEKQDARTHHEALPVVKGIKKAANAWIHLCVHSATCVEGDPDHVLRCAGITFTFPITGAAPERSTKRGGGNRGGHGWPARAETFFVSSPRTFVLASAVKQK